MHKLFMMTDMSESERVLAKKKISNKTQLRVRENLCLKLSESGLI